MHAEPIQDEPSERTLAQQIEDESIETKAEVNIHAANEAFFDANLAIVSYNGYVLLAGQVRTEELKNQATDVVREIHGVRRIYNELEIASPSSAMTRSSDTWITTKVKTWLLGRSDTEGTQGQGRDGKRRGLPDGAGDEGGGTAHIGSRRRYFRGPAGSATVRAGRLAARCGAYLTIFREGRPSGLIGSGGGSSGGSVTSSGSNTMPWPFSLA